MRIAVFEDAAFHPMPTYTAADATTALATAGQDVANLDSAGLARLTSSEADVLVLPYVDGTFEDGALKGIVAFHAAGGGVVILGDLPHRGPWYPYRNMESWQLRMTRANGPFRIDGLSDSGKRVLGWDSLPDASFFEGRTLNALRTSAFPPDVTHLLVHSRERDMNWHATPIIAVERFGEPFFGARFAMVGFNGGEPRENVAGVGNLPWSFDPGLLTREWRGMNILLCRLVEWCAPRKVAVRLDVPAVRRGNDPGVVQVRVRNFGANARRLVLHTSREVAGGGDSDGNMPSLPTVEANGIGRLVNETVVDAMPGEHSFQLYPASREFGMYRHGAELEGDGEVLASHGIVEHVLPSDERDSPGYGFSTFWAFPGGRVVDAFRGFCHEMKRLGCLFVRVNIPWEDIEPEPGRYDWSLPDDMLALARDNGLILRFWMFPTTRGSGLGEAGVPEWSLREPAVAVDGRKGYFPSLWSPFYRKHYFNMVREFARRYADARELDRLVIDFGNSDFPYGYFYYGGDNTIFDYSTWEQEAFRKYVKVQAGDDSRVAEKLLGMSVRSNWDNVHVPRPVDEKAWRLYLDFRCWSVQQGIAEVEKIIREEAPAKLSPDLPGHGAGSIADLASFGLDAKRRHAAEEPGDEAELCRLHNAGASWGGEAWQVGARYREYDDALFQSLRLNADYLTLPGVDLGAYGDDVARIGFIRRTMAGAQRDKPVVAIFDRLEWNAWQSLAQIGSRLDVEVDLLQAAHRHDFSNYKVVVLPPEPRATPGTVTGGGGGRLVPCDLAWWRRLRSAVEQGLNVLLFPGTIEDDGLPWREAFQLPEVRYGERRERVVRWPASFGGGEAHGQCKAVFLNGEQAMCDADGEPILVIHPLGRGALWFAGYDNGADSLDGQLNYERDTDYAGHSLARFLSALGIRPVSLDSGNCNAWKSLVRRDERVFLLVFSHRERVFRQTFWLRSERPLAGAWDLATGERFSVTPGLPDWWQLDMTVHPRQGRYIVLVATPKNNDTIEPPIKEHSRCNSC